MYLKAIALAGAMLAATAAAAHSPTKGPHGGRVEHAGKYHVELVTMGQTVDVFVTDANDKPVSAKGFKATAILLAGGKSQRVPLEPAEGGRLSGTAPVALPANVKGAVQLTAPGGKTAQGKFN